MFKAIFTLTIFMFFVEYALSHKWSPEQIAGVSKIVGYTVSHEL